MFHKRILAIVLFHFILFQCALAKKTKKVSYKIEALPNSYAELGEGPHWDVATQSLYYIDIFGARILRYDSKKNKVYSCKIEGEKYVSFIIPIEGEAKKFAIGCGRRVLAVKWNGKSKDCEVEKVIFEVEKHPRFINNRFNDAKCDPRGRLFAGTMTQVENPFVERKAHFYKYEGGKFDVVMTNRSISNGLVWNEAAKKFYYADTSDFDVKEFDYDLDKGTFSNPKVIYTVDNKEIGPDGMTIDTEGNLYVAMDKGGSVFKIDPRTSKVLLKIDFPTKETTSVAWGGPNLDILYVTSSDKFEKSSHSGLTYKVTGLGAKGFPMQKMKL